MTRWLTRLVALAAPLAVAAALLAIVGVFAGDVPATGENADDRALTLAVDVRSLAVTTVALGRRVQLRPRDDGSRERLRDVADRAHRIEYAVRQIDVDETSRGDVRLAALNVAEAAAVLARLDRGDRAERRRRARRALRDAQRALRQAAGELADGGVPDAEPALAEVRRRIPDVLVAGPARR